MRVVRRERLLGRRDVLRSYVGFLRAYLLLKLKLRAPSSPATCTSLLDSSIKVRYYHAVAIQHGCLLIKDGYGGLYAMAVLRCVDFESVISVASGRDEPGR